MLAAPAPLMSADGNVRTRRSRRGGRRCHARSALVQGALRQERASKRTGILQSWMRLQAALRLSENMACIGSIVSDGSEVDRVRGKVGEISADD